MKLTIEQLRTIIKEEVTRVVEGTRNPGTFADDLRRAPIGTVFDYVRVFRGPKATPRKASVTKVAREGRPGAYVFKLGREETPFDRAADLAYGIGEFDVI